MVPDRIKATSMSSQLSVQDDFGNSVDDSEAIKQELVNELTRLELSLNEAKIIVRLVSRGPAIASDISRDLSMPRTETYHYISSLLGKGIVLSTFSKPRKYYSLSFDEVVDHLVQTKYN
ncbi:MAG TPA: helix-turn-helix domain-containing protein, partial [Nitrososphaera sp.]|nr:helix-turn-helix domain-containing protein [Nitrososphaera sp.]